jgi:hypothetical protein
MVTGRVMQHGDTIVKLRLSRDGKKLALARGSKTSDVALISDLGGTR